MELFDHGIIAALKKVISDEFTSPQTPQTGLSRVA